MKLETSRGEVLESQAAWDELQARLGATLPAGSMRFWMLGIPAPGEHRWLEPAAEGEQTLEQDGWQINYQRYANDSGARVPVRIRATSGDTRVRIVIDRWRLGE
jgi:outer membrane lipoprotein LolB